MDDIDKWMDESFQDILPIVERGSCQMAAAGVVDILGSGRLPCGTLKTNLALAFSNLTLSFSLWQRRQKQELSLSSSFLQQALVTTMSRVVLE